MTVGVTAGWVEDDGSVVPYPLKFPDASRVVPPRRRAGLLEGAPTTAIPTASSRTGASGLASSRATAAEHREFMSWLPGRAPRASAAGPGHPQDFLGRAVDERSCRPATCCRRRRSCAAAAAGIRIVVVPRRDALGARRRDSRSWTRRASWPSTTATSSAAARAWLGSTAGGRAWRAATPRCARGGGVNICLANEYFPPHAAGRRRVEHRGRLAQALARHGERVVVVTPNYGAPAARGARRVPRPPLPFPVKRPAGRAVS